MTNYPENALIHVDAKRCVRCGACVRDCLAKVVELADDGVPQATPDAESRCYRCQHCVAVCPTGALTWRDVSAEKCATLGATPSPETMENLLRQRRSVRAFQRENVSPYVFQRLIRSTDHVPTGCNDRALFYSYSNDIETTDVCRRDAAKYMLERLDAGTLPQNLMRFAVCRPALESGVDVFFRNAPHFVAIAVSPEAKDAHIDPYIAAAQFELLVCSFGLGTCWAGMATDLFATAPELGRRLNIPEQFQLKIVLLFGKPDVAYARATRPEPYPFTFVSK